MNKKTMLLLTLLVLTLAGVTIYLRGSVLVNRVTLDKGVLSNQSGSVMEKQTVGSFSGVLPAMDVMPIAPPYNYDPSYDFGNALNKSERSYEMYASFSLVASDVPAYFRQLREYVLSVGGRVLSLQTGNHSKYQTGYMTAKVPVAKFDEATARVTEKVSSVESQQLNATDVTGQVEAIKSQIADLEDQKAQKEIELVGAKTEVERRQIELEIKRLEKQLEQMKNQDIAQAERVEYATLNVSASSSKNFYNPQARPDLWEELTGAYNSVLDNLYIVAQFLIWVVVYGAILTPLVIIVGVLKRRAKNKKELDT